MKLFLLACFHIQLVEDVNERCILTNMVTFLFLFDLVLQPFVYMFKLPRESSINYFVTEGGGGC